MGVLNIVRILVDELLEVWLEGDVVVVDPESEANVPTPQEIAPPLGWVEFAGGVDCPEGEAIVKRVVHVELAVSSPFVN